MTVAPIAAIAPMAVEAASLPSLAAPITPPTTSFSGLLLEGLGQVDRKVAEADAMATAFTLDDTIPVHQVTYALEQARLSVELMVQVRSRLLEGYQELMRMQL